MKPLIDRRKIGRRGNAKLQDGANVNRLRLGLSGYGWEMVASTGEVVNPVIRPLKVVLKKLTSCA